MSDVALLNPRQDAAASRALIDVTSERMKVLQAELATTVLDREPYLLKIGAANELERLIAEMQRIYDRNFNT